MKRASTMNPTTRIVLTSVMVAFATVSLHAEVLVDPAAGSGADAINPDDGTIHFEDTAASGYASETTLEGISNFRSLQGLNGTRGNDDFNVFAFSDSDFPDLQFDQPLGNEAGWDKGGDNGTSASNGSYPFQLDAFLTITFGTWDGVAETFTADRTVDASSLTIRNFKIADVNVLFYDASGVLLSEQSITTTSGDNGQGAYFGTNVGGISYLTVEMVTDNNTRAWIDDIGMTTIPEPTSLALLGLGGLAMLRRRRA